jgi:peptide/nickel transport system permease protein
MVRACLPLHISSVIAFLLVTAVMGLVGWARPARLVRGIALAAKESGFVMSARGFGASDFYLIRRHVLPETFSVLLTQLALLVPQYIMAEVTLSYLGLGVGEPTPSLGNLLASAQSYHVLVSYWWMMLPAVAIIPVILAYNHVAETLQRSMGEAQ